MGGMTVACKGCGVTLYMKTLSSILAFVSQVHRKYTAADFDDDLRTVLRRSGCRDEKIVFIMDESNVLESGFLERMNTLLANGEVRSLLLFQAVKCLVYAIIMLRPVFALLCHMIHGRQAGHYTVTSCGLCPLMSCDSLLCPQWEQLF